MEYNFCPSCETKLILKDFTKDSSIIASKKVEKLSVDNYIITDVERRDHEELMLNFRIQTYFSKKLTQTSNPKFFEFFKFQQDYSGEKYSIFFFGMFIIGAIVANLLFSNRDSLSSFGFIFDTWLVVSGIIAVIGGLFFFLIFLGYLLGLISEYGFYRRGMKEQYKRMKNCSHEDVISDKCTNCNYFSNFRDNIKKFVIFEEIEHINTNIKGHLSLEYGGTLEKQLVRFQQDSKINNNLKKNIFSFLEIYKKLHFDLNIEIDLDLLKKLEIINISDRLNS
jgi:hypothetical protein